MTKPNLMELAEAERADLLRFLRELTPAQWEAPSLCTRWTVRDVAIHIVSYDELSAPTLVTTFLRGGLRVGKVNDIALNRCGKLSQAGVIDLVARHQRPRGLTSMFGGGIALTDGTIHHQDIRRALNLPRTIPPERLIPVLNFALSAPTLPAKKNSKGLCLTATDVDWTSGDGPDITGPGEALLMAVAGRTDSLSELTGTGLEILSQRLN